MPAPSPLSHGSQGYGSIAAAKEVGISLRQLYYWVDVLQVVRPQLRACGTRQFRRFTTADLSRLKAVCKLVERGYTLRAAVKIVTGHADASRLRSP